MAEKNNKAMWLTIVGVFLVLVAIVSIVSFLLGGQTTTDNQSGNIISSESLTCKGIDVPYQFISYDNSKEKRVKITISFNDNELSAISFFYDLYYNDAQSIETSKTVNSAELNVFYGKDGLPANSFSKSLTGDGQKATIALYANATDFNDRTSKYFMADGLGMHSNSESFMKKYAEQGLNCIKN